MTERVYRKSLSKKLQKEIVMKTWLIILVPLYLIAYLSNPLGLINPVDHQLGRQDVNFDKSESRQWPEAELLNFANVKDFGARGDGSTNDTTAIQSLLDQKRSVYIPDGVYLIDVERALNLRSNQTLHLSDGAVLKALASDEGYSAVLRLKNISNTHISGGKIIGERYSHQGNVGEWGMGIQIIEGSHHITVHQVEISDCWGDGIFIGDSPTVSDVLIEGVSCDNNRRQGLSITDAKRIIIKDSVFMNTNGALPEAGIDIEPDSGQRSENIQIINVDCLNNNGSGLDLMGITGLVRDVVVEDSYFANNKGYGIRFFDDVQEVSLRNLQIENNYSQYPRKIERNNQQRFRQVVMMIVDKLKDLQFI